MFDYYAVNIWLEMILEPVALVSQSLINVVHLCIELHGGTLHPDCSIKEAKVINRGGKRRRSLLNKPWLHGLMDDAYSAAESQDEQGRRRQGPSE